jgi:hypothetical protein
LPLVLLGKAGEARFGVVEIRQHLVDARQAVGRAGRIGGKLGLLGWL